MLFIWMLCAVCCLTITRDALEKHSGILNLSNGSARRLGESALPDIIALIQFTHYLVADKANGMALYKSMCVNYEEQLTLVGLFCGTVLDHEFLLSLQILSIVLPPHKTNTVGFDAFEKTFVAEAGPEASRILYADMRRLQIKKLPSKSVHLVFKVLEVFVDLNLIAENVSTVQRLLAILGISNGADYTLKTVIPNYGDILLQNSLIQIQFTCDSSNWVGTSLITVVKENPFSIDISYAQFYRRYSLQRMIKEAQKCNECLLRFEYNGELKEESKDIPKEKKCVIS